MTFSIMRSFLVLAATAPLACGIIVDSGTSDTNSRFDTNRGGATFVADGFDLSGVGRSTSGGRWATAISPNVIVSAGHNFPAGTRSTLRFYESNDPAGPSITRDVVSSININALDDGTTQSTNSDIRLGVLDSPLPSNYAFYDFMTENIFTQTDYSSSSLRFDNTGSPASQNVVTGYTFGGQNISGSPSNAPTSQWIGRNTIDRFFDDINTNAINRFGDAVGLDYNTPFTDSAPSVPYESLAQGGDSGAPLFIEDNGELTLVGPAWFVYQDGETGPDVGTGYSLMGNYDAQIQAFIDENAIPEPSSLVLIFTGLTFVAGRRSVRHN